MVRQISVAIPHYNNAEFMRETLEHIYNDDRISEIVICDDCSKDFEELQSIVSEFNNNKIVLLQNERNLGCYHNKLHSVSKCSNDWAILLDSDNIMKKDYIDTLFNIEKWNTNTIYAPVWAKTFPGERHSKFLNYNKFKNQYITPEMYLHYFSTTDFKCLINTCNYFLPTKQYLDVMNKYNYVRETIDCFDSAVLFTDWLCNNNEVFVVDGLIYLHRCHANSNYVLTASKTDTKTVERNLVDKIKSFHSTSLHPALPN